MLSIVNQLSNVAQKFELEKAEAKAHILEGLVKAQDRIDDVIAVGKASSSREQFEAVLQGTEIMPGIAAFDFTEPQAKAIAERRLYQLSRLDVEKVQNDYNDLKIKIADLKDIIASRIRRLNILTEELNEMVERHGDERRSRNQQDAFVHGPRRFDRRTSNRYHSNR